MARLRILILVAVAVLPIACDENLTAGVGVDNRTSLELHFSVLLDAVWYNPVAKAHPHQTELVVPVSILPAGGCTKGGMIALAEDGREIARHDAPLCVGDVWVIDISGASSSPSP